ncbi:MAG: hypothetical protein N3A65_08345 [candidate division WOR-3 bacterium]|nr:hypothetical protein [candidate division WOR-3 bacterium]
MHKNIYFIIIKGIIVSLSVFIIFLTLNSNCKNPDEYRPPFDSLYPPPPAPRLISPKNDTSFWFQTPFPHNITLKWSSVDNVEYYQLQVANDTTIHPNTPLINVEACSTIHTVSKNGFYFWRVRAYNRKWTWYTDWSQIWHFGVFYSP